MTGTMPEHLLRQARATWRRGSAPGFRVSGLFNIPVSDAEGENLAADSHLPTTLASGCRVRTRA
jgi:hypothetical protein